MLQVCNITVCKMNEKKNMKMRCTWDEQSSLFCKQFKNQPHSSTLLCTDPVNLLALEKTKIM